MTHTEYTQIKERNKSILWAQSIFECQDKYLILDTETTGLKDSDVVINIAMMDLSGNLLLESWIRPTGTYRMSSEATMVHGKSRKDLKNEQTFDQVWPYVLQFSEGKTLLIYNEEFHLRMIGNTLEKEGIPFSELQFASEDVQIRYEKFMKSYYHLRLPGRNNTGEGDCLAVLKVIEGMASTTIDNLEEQYALESLKQEKTEKLNRDLSSKFKTTYTIAIIFILAVLFYGYAQKGYNILPDIVGFTFLFYVGRKIYKRLKR